MTCFCIITRHPCSWIHLPKMRIWKQDMGKRRLTVAVMFHEAFTYCFKRKHDVLRKLTRVTFMNILLDGETLRWVLWNKQKTGRKKCHIALMKQPTPICCAFVKELPYQSRINFSTLVRRKRVTTQEIEVVQLL